MLFFFSVLEQFDVVVLNIFFVFSVFHIFFDFGLCFLCFMLFYYIFISDCFLTLCLTNWYFFFNYLYLLFYYFFREKVGFVDFFQFKIVFFIFLFLFVLNLYSLLPFSFVVTSHLSITLAISFSFFFSITYLSCNFYGFYFFNIFVPSGVPVFVVYFLCDRYLFLFCIWIIVIL